VELVNLPGCELSKLSFVGLRARLCGHCDCGLLKAGVDLHASLGLVRSRLVDKGLVKDLT
jgi:hypothetical protein